MNEIDQTVERIKQRGDDHKLYCPTCKAGRNCMDHLMIRENDLQEQVTQLKADLATAVNEADALRAEVELARQILSGEHLEIQFDKGGYRFNYHDYDDTKAMWCAFNMRDGKYIGDPQRFYPLIELLELHAAIKPNAAGGEGTE